MIVDIAEPRMDFSRKRIEDIDFLKINPPGFPFDFTPNFVALIPPGIPTTTGGGEFFLEMPFMNSYFMNVKNC